ncbi:YqhV family protein [Scopulibacillus cellulosilyticus]|uniref:YqhV family protein n=1 Tax=Scopulibacillus cellulosilyticus TaxID=2665665 RepID=A0ABW2Q1Y4_9BACL
MRTFIENAVVIMASFRILSGLIEITAAILILKFNSIEKGLMINSALALVGPAILIITTTVGLLGLTDRISYQRIIWVMVGVTCILFRVKGQT